MRNQKAILVSFVEYFEIVISNKCKVKLGKIRSSFRFCIVKQDQYAYIRVLIQSVGRKND